MDYTKPIMEVAIFDYIFTRLDFGSVDYGTDLTNEDGEPEEGGF